MIEFYLNDRLVRVRNVSPNTTLLNFLRSELGQTGTKEGCAEGDCGACTVAVKMWTQENEGTYRSINSCIVPLPSMHQRRIYTVEGLKKKGEYHPVQKAMVEALGSQCGYCTPGFVMSLFAACYREDLQEDWQKEDQICGNLCRCTGYRPIRDALNKTAGTGGGDHFQKILSTPRTSRALSYHNQEEAFFIPTSLDELWKVWEIAPAATCFSGATDLGLEITKKRKRFGTLISLEEIPELKTIEDQDTHWYLGASVSLSDIESFSQENIPSLARMLRYFGGRQIKNRATLGGNICTASPIGDTPPVLIALDAEFVLCSRLGSRVVRAEEFFEDYRKTALQDQEILAAVRIPKLPLGVYAASFKVSKRRELDISAVSLSVFLDVEAQTGIVRALRLAYGGMAAIPKRAYKTEAQLVGRTWTEEHVVHALMSIRDDFAPLSDHRASAWYRTQVARNLLLGLYHETLSHQNKLPPRHASTLILEQNS
ncbi:MAG: xanthine dehydrogenase small subunit [Deltaproteobacteria bacterium]|nr:xanthine dehydrogenase small subunit [Deltaproteobacteria bacterium]